MVPNELLPRVCKGYVCIIACACEYISIYNQERTCLSSAPVPLRNFTVQPSVADMEKGCKSIGVILSGRSWGSWFGADRLESTVLI